MPYLYGIILSLSNSDLKLVQAHPSCPWALSSTIIVLLVRKLISGLLVQAKPMQSSQFLLLLFIGFIHLAKWLLVALSNCVPEIEEGVHWLENIGTFTDEFIGSHAQKLFVSWKIYEMPIFFKKVLSNSDNIIKSLDLILRRAHSYIWKKILYPST